MGGFGFGFGDSVVIGIGLNVSIAFSSPFLALLGDCREMSSVCIFLSDGRGSQIQHSV